MTTDPRSAAAEISLQVRNIIVLAHALGLDLATVARALDDSGLMLRRTRSHVAADVLYALPHSPNGDGKRNRSR